MSCTRPEAGGARYRFLDGLGEVVAETVCADHASARAAAQDLVEDGEVTRVEYLGPEGDWRWAGPLLAPG